MANRTEKKWANGGSRFVNLKFKLIVYFMAISIRSNFWGLLKKVEEERCSVLVGVINSSICKRRMDHGWKQPKTPARFVEIRS